MMFNMDILPPSGWLWWNESVSHTWGCHTELTGHRRSTNASGCFRTLPDTPCGSMASGHTAAAISTAARSQEWPLALQVFQDMQLAEVRTTVVSFTSTIAAARWCTRTPKLGCRFNFRSSSQTLESTARRTPYVEIPMVVNSLVVPKLPMFTERLIQLPTITREITSLEPPWHGIAGGSRLSSASTPSGATPCGPMWWPSPPPWGHADATGSWLGAFLLRCATQKSRWMSLPSTQPLGSRQVVLVAGFTPGFELPMADCYTHMAGKPHLQWPAVNVSHQK